MPATPASPPSSNPLPLDGWVEVNPYQWRLGPDNGSGRPSVRLLRWDPATGRGGEDQPWHVHICTVVHDSVETGSSIAHFTDLNEAKTVASVIAKLRGIRA